MNDTIVNKVQSIQRCVARAREIYSKRQKDFLSDHDAQDAAVLNIMRACELSIDLANYIIKARKLGIPTSSADSFELLARNQIIGQDVAEKLKNMVGFRNISVHEYQNINYQIVVSVIEKELDDLVRFTELVMAVE